MFKSWDNLSDERINILAKIGFKAQRSRIDLNLTIREFLVNINGKVILIVGASTGMGRVVALKAASLGAKLAITARSEDKLDKLKGEIRNIGAECLCIAADALDENASEQLVSSVVRHFSCIDIVLLNVGGAPAIDMRTMNASEVKWYMRSNYDVTVNYLFPVLTQMKVQKSGLVVHTNSLAGFLGLPMQGPYSAAKGATRLLMDTCRIEFSEYGIKFLTVYPGFIATARTQGDGMKAPLELSEEKGADHILYAIEKDKANYLFPFVMRWLIRLARVLPQRLLNAILKRGVPTLRDDSDSKVV